MADFPLGRRFWRERPRLTRALLALRPLRLRVRHRNRLVRVEPRVPRRRLSRSDGSSTRTSRVRRRSSTPPTDASSPSSGSSAARWSSSPRFRRSCRKRSSSPRTSASTITPASTGRACSARSLADIRAPELRAGLLDDHDAARAKHVPRAISREKTLSESSRKRRSRAQIEAAVSEGKDPRALSQPDLSRQRRLRRRDGLAALLRQIRARSQSRRGSDAGGAAQRRRSATIRVAIPSARSSAATRSSS